MSVRSRSRRLRVGLALAGSAGLVAAGLTVAAPVATADPAHTPGGPCLQPEQEVKRSSVANYDEVVRKLAQIENNSQGRVQVDSVGLSGEGRELFYATVGEGDTTFWLQARIHGNELQSTQAVLDILQQLGSSGSPEAQLIRDELTVIVIPMYNPDGSEANIRQSVTPTRTDLNRDWENFAQPESRAYWKLFSDLQPELALDLHHMGTAPRVAGTDDLNQFQIGARTVDPNRLLPEQWDLARQMSEVSLNALEGYGQTHLARYSDIDITNAVLSRMLLGGTAPAGETPMEQGTTKGAIFYEVRGVGQKSNGYLANLFARPTMAVLKAAADGSLYTSDWDSYDALPYGRSGSCGF